MCNPGAHRNLKTPNEDFSLLETEYFQLIVKNCVLIADWYNLYDENLLR